MSKFIVYSKNNGQVWNVLNQYMYEEDGTLAGGFNGINTLRYHVSTNPAVLEISDENLEKLNLNNLQNYVIVGNTVVEKSEGPVVTDDINLLKTHKIKQSKLLLKEWLEKSPMQYTDGKYYSVTEEKQSLLNGKLDSYERAQAAGIDYPLRWNSTGDECIEWTYEELVGLSLAIAAYVAPKVSIQQSIEVAINNCSTIEEINEIVINYDE